MINMKKIKEGLAKVQGAVNTAKVHYGHDAAETEKQQVKSQNLIKIILEILRHWEFARYEN